MPETSWLYVFAMFNYFVARRLSRRIRDDFYGRIVALSRHPAPYARWGVPDTVEGRFEMLTLGLFLVLERLHRAGPSQDGLAQDLVDAFFADLDAAHRQMGVGDMKVPRQMRQLADAVRIRLQAYRAAAGGESVKGLAHAIGDHFASHDPAPAVQAVRLADCAMTALEALDRVGMETLKQPDTALAPLIGCKD